MATEDMIVAAACLYQRGYSAKTLVRIYWPWTIGRRSTAVCGWCSPVAAVWWDAPRGTDAGSPDWWSCSATHTQQTVRWPIRHCAYVCACVRECAHAHLQLRRRITSHRRKTMRDCSLPTAEPTQKQAKQTTMDWQRCLFKHAQKTN